MIPNDDTPGSPFAAGYPASKSRLSILHLLGITACVASYLGILQTVRSLSADPGFEGVFPLMSVYGVASGASLFGLILLVVRRRRGTLFPVHPGEYLLVVQAVGALLYLAVYSPIVIRENYSAGMLVLFVLAAVSSGLHYWAAVQTRNRPWKIFFFVCIVRDFLFPVALCGGVFWIIDHRIRHLAEVFLIFALVRDRQHGLRYPWTHWFGVGVHLWHVVVNLGWGAWMSVVQ